CSSPIECNDGIRDRDRGPSGRRGPLGEPRQGFRTLSAVAPAPADACDWVVLTDAELPVDGLHAWAATPSAGAVVTCVGVVRDHAEGREGVHTITHTSPHS